MLTTSFVEAFSDNYIWVLHDRSRAIAVDPGDAAPLQAFLAAEGLTLDTVLITHRHADHVGGLPQLARQTPGLRVIGPATLAGVTEAVADGDRFTLLSMPFDVLAVPGHTLDHLAYHCEAGLFCGDTLFGAGCGRLFEGTPAQMHASLARLAALPDDTRVFPAHEYTLANLRFASAVEPSNPDITARIGHDGARRQAGLPTLPSLLSSERATNPFLRTASPAIGAALARRAGREIDDPVERFALLRAWKDSF